MGLQVDAVAVADLDDLAEVHHRDLGAEVPHDGQVVGDEEERDVELLLDPLKQVDHLAWIDTSSAETGSSATSSLGFRVRARAMPMRCAGRRRTRWGTGCSARG
jgi:hypothetical protein